MSRLPIIFLSAAEASGDRHGAALVRALRRRLPEARILGAAGPLMAEAGCEIVADLTAQASMVGGPFLKLGYWFRTVKRLQAAVRDARPDVFVPIDSPALNWHLCEAARSVGSSVMYYIAPQVWAWAPWRIKKIRRLTDAVACILPFEESYLRQRGVNARFVGHPLFDVQRGAGGTPAPRPDLLQAWGEGAWRIAVVPGSRRGEVAGHIEPLLTVIQSLASRWPAAQFTIAAHNEGIAEIVRNACRKANVEVDESDAGETAQRGMGVPPMCLEGFQPSQTLDNNQDSPSGTSTATGGTPVGRMGETPMPRETPPRIHLTVAQTPRVLATSHFGLIKSGTVTLEAAAAGLPMVIFYKTGPVMAALHRTIGRCQWFMPTPFLSLVNILAGYELVPELMPWRGNPAHLETAAVAAMSDLGRLVELRDELVKLVQPLQPNGDQNAADRAAEMVVELLSRKPIASSQQVWQVLACEDSL